MAEIKDWELNDDYFQAEDSAKELKLEDFMTEEPSEHDGSDGTFGFFGDTTDQNLLQKTIQDVHEVLTRAQKGDTIQEIAAELELDVISRCLRRVSGRTMRLRWRIWL